ncbi:unnamed protein product [Macrosiphum euphorbiae]|uniref:Uncharacterized protein n=1 Tax=Macrosiphum euphorbiae TaxID=13131 RepID=A0AAV0X744_9HEMI|nr:unnamed protein product [Macrosiphum euphorbiae]
MTTPVRLPLILLALQQYARTVSAVSGSVDEFQCACGYNAAGHVRVVRDTLAGGGDTEAAVAVDLAAGYGPLVSRILFVVSSRPEPTARWLWLFDLYANGASQQLTAATDRRRRGARWLARAVNYVGRELDRYLAICGARGVGGGGPPWRDQASFEKYVLENVTAIVQRSTDGAARVEDFAPRWLYLNHVAADDDALRARGVMPPGAGVDWRSSADRLSSVYRAAVHKWVFGTRELVVYQKKFIAAVVVTLMGHVLAHVEHCRTHRLLAAAHPDETVVAHSDVSVAAAATTDDNEDYNLNGGVGGPVGDYELTWMSVGALLEKYKSYLALGPEKYYRTLVEVAANPARDDRGFRLARRAIETHMADLGAGLFGPAATNWTAVVDETAVKKPQTLIELIALVDNNISTAERYLKNVQDLLSNVDFKIVGKFMRSTHIWLS